jgi:hypothetical protein
MSTTLDRLTVFGLFAVVAMLVCYALENRSPWFILAFAGAGLRRRVCPGVDVRLPPGRMAVRPGGSRLVGSRALPMAVEVARRRSREVYSAR